MPRQIVRHTSRQTLVAAEGKLSQLASWLQLEIEDAFSSRTALEAQWREDMRLYEALPRNAMNNFPIENAPNIEIPLGAIASDAIAAQALDVIFGTTPLVTCRPVPKSDQGDRTPEMCKALQRWINWVATNESGVRVAAEEMILDDVQLGTGVLYTPWIERTKKTRTARVLSRHPVIRSLAPEDVIVPGGSYDDIEELMWIGLRSWLTRTEVEQRARRNGWEVDGFQTAGAKDWVRTRREMLGKQMEGVQRKAQLYDVYDIYCFFDIDDDGIDEDLHITYNHTGVRIGKVQYNPFDRRPLNKAVYQRRPHLWYGLGVVHMLRSFQVEMSDLHNYQVLNALLANCRMWATREGVIPEGLKIWPNKQISTPNPSEDIKELKLSDVYTSLPQIQMMVMQLAERRTGVNEMSFPRQSAVMGSRTPGITSLSMLQQANRRFTPAFDSMRIAIAGALMQCLYRYQERLLAGDLEIEVHIIEVLGQQDGADVITLLKDQKFDEHVIAELTAASASVNKEADRQNSIMLAQLLATYYQRTLELTMLAADPNTPPPVRDVALKIAESAGEVIDRTIRTFDQVRDPATFIIDVDDALSQVEQPTQEGIGGLEGLMQQLLGGGGQQASQQLEGL